ncbi:MAG: hypothetical protein PUA90_02765 [bacterium]|nr:hypothetical protein [bacterium]
MKKITIIIFSIFLLVGCNSKKEEVPENNNAINDIKINNKVENITPKGITVEVKEFYYKDGYSTVNLSITNNNDYSVYIDSYIVYVYDKEDNLLGIFNPKFDSTINKGDTANQMFSTNIDFTNSDRIKYEFNNIEKID